MNIAKNLILAIPIAGFLLLLAYAKPYGQNMEVLLIDMVGFLFKKKSVGAVEAEGKKVKEKEQDKKDKKDKAKEEEKEKEEKIEVPVPITTLQATPMKGEVAAEEEEERSEHFIPLTMTTTTVPINNTANLLHYIVPASKDFNLEIAEEKEYVIATGESTIHIAEDISNAIIVIEVKDRSITRIIVNKQ